ncbi:COP1-interactive protein 1-like [Penaeus japonicus]|uniref:COP1-interactive protein 1-like n=1 Tax=Penaeus japonicus TaxID=27405 RepID=UPI001C71061A|nr:COP1-interactive protein 1-like [Penaeus japonicus]
MYSYIAVKLNYSILRNFRRDPRCPIVPERLKRKEKICSRPQFFSDRPVTVQVGLYLLDAFTLRDGWNGVKTSSRGCEHVIHIHEKVVPLVTPKRRMCWFSVIQDLQDKEVRRKLNLAQAIRFISFKCELRCTSALPRPRQTVIKLNAHHVFLFLVYLDKMWRQALHTEGRELSHWNFPARNSAHTALKKKCSEREGAVAMEDLHKQLQQETENIVRWKASTEMNTKQLERQLNEAQVTIADQRRNLMELQLSSENLSQSLLRERQERDLIAAKVTHTRELFLTLEQQKEELVVTLSLFQQDKDLLSNAHNDTIQKINELTENFHSLSMLHKQQVDSITAEAASEVNQLQEKIASKEQELKEMNESLSRLAQIKSMYEEKVSELTELLKITEGSLFCAQDKNTALELEIVEVKGTLESVQKEMEEHIEGLTVQVTKLQEDLKQEECRRTESQKEFEEAVEKIQYLKKANGILEGSKSEILDKLEAMTTRKQELEKELDCSNNKITNLQGEHAEMEREVQLLSLSLKDMHAKFAHLNSDIQDVQKDKQYLKTQLDESKELLEVKDKHVKHQEEQIAELTEVLQVQKKAEEESKAELQCCRDRNDEMSNAIENLNKQIQENADAAVKLQEDLALEADQNIRSLEGDIQTLNEQLTSVRNEWTADNESYELKIQNLTNTAAEVEAELKRQISDIEGQCKKTANEKNTLNKGWEEQQALVKSQKVQLKEHEKELKSKNKALNQEIKKREKTEAAIAALEKKLQSIETERNTLQSELRETLCAQEVALKLQEEKQKALEEELQNKVTEINGLQDLVRTHEANLQETQQKVVDLQEALDAALSNLNIKRDTVDAKDIELDKLKCQSDEAKMNLANQLQEKEEQLATSSNICERLQSDVASLKRCMEEQRSNHMAEVQALEESVDEAKKSLKRVKQEMIKVNKEKEDVMQEADTKVKDMLGIIERYRSDNEVNMKKITAELLETQQKLAMKEADIANVASANTKLLVEAVAGTKTNAKPKTTTVYTEELPLDTDEELKTPSPRQYLSRRRPPFGLYRNTPTAKALPVTRCLGDMPHQEDRTQLSILKAGPRRILVPPTEQKRVVFKSPVSKICANDGDSSSDANAYELEDSFDEIVNPRKRKTGYIPSANVAPTTSAKSSLSMVANVSSDRSPLCDVQTKNDQQQNEESGKRLSKKVKSHKMKYGIKTYSAISPKNKHNTENQEPKQTGEGDWIN